MYKLRVRFGDDVVLQAFSSHQNAIMETLTNSSDILLERKSCPDDIIEHPDHYRIVWYPEVKPMLIVPVDKGLPTAIEYVKREIDKWEQRQLDAIETPANHIVMLYRYHEAGMFKANNYRSTDFEHEYPLLHAENAVNGEGLKTYTEQVLREGREHANKIADIHKQAREYHNELTQVTDNAGVYVVWKKVRK